MSQDLKYIFISIAVVLLLGGGVLGYFALTMSGVDVPPPPSPGGLTEEERRELEEKLNPPGTPPTVGPGVMPPSATFENTTAPSSPGYIPPTREENIESNDSTTAPSR